MSVTKRQREQKKRDRQQQKAERRAQRINEPDSIDETEVVRETPLGNEFTTPER